MIPTRLAEDADIPLDFEGAPQKVLVSFFYQMKAHEFIDSGWRRPRKVRGVWVVRKWSDRVLRVRTDREGHTSFVGDACEVPAK